MNLVVKIDIQYFFFQNITFAFGCVFQVSRMSEKAYEGEEHFDQYDHYNYDQEKAMVSGNSGEWGP